MFTPPEGRINRKEFWPRFLVLKTLEVTTDFYLYKNEDDFTVWTWLVYFTHIFLFVCLVFLCTRRLHDLGRSGHWLWILLGGTLALEILQVYSEAKGNYIAASMAFLAFWGVHIWFLIWFALPGNTGPNKFGLAEKT